MSPTGVAQRPAEPPRVDPRMRARWVRARRQEGRRRLRFLAAGGALVVLAGAAAGVTQSPLLEVRTVVITGAVHETRGDVLVASGLGSHPPMIGLDPGSLDRRIDALPWVAAARVRRQWPTTVKVEIQERTAVAVVAAAPAPTPAATLAAVNAGSATMLVDATGRVLASATGVVPGLPVVLGAAAPGAVGSWLPGTAPRQGPRPATPLEAVLTLASDLPASLSASVVSLVVRPDGTLGGTVTSPPSTSGSGGAGAGPGDANRTEETGVSVPVEFGDASDLPAKIVTLQTLMAQIDLSHVTAIDVSDSQRPYLTGNPQSAIVSTTAGG